MELIFKWDVCSRQTYIQIELVFKLGFIFKLELYSRGTQIKVELIFEWVFVQVGLTSCNSKMSFEKKVLAKFIYCDSFDTKH